MHMAHRPGRPIGVDHANKGERRMNSNLIVSHATLILQYHPFHGNTTNLRNHVHFGCRRCDTTELRVHVLTSS